MAPQIPDSDIAELLELAKEFVEGWKAIWGLDAPIRS